VASTVGTGHSGEQAAVKWAKADAGALALREAVITHFTPNGSLKDLKVLITAGPTREDIGPGAVLSSTASTGKMGLPPSPAAPMPARADPGERPRQSATPPR